MGGKGDFGKRKEAGEGASQLCSEERYVGVESGVVRARASEDDTYCTVDSALTISPSIYCSSTIFTIVSWRFESHESTKARDRLYALVKWSHGRACKHVNTRRIHRSEAHILVHEQYT